MNYITQNYFNSKAKLYQKRQNSFPWSLVRKIELIQIKRNLKKIKLNKCLELGAGSGNLTNLLLSLNIDELQVIDFSQKMLDEILPDRRIQKFTSSVEAFIPPNEDYDLIIGFGVFEFIDSSELQIERYLKYLKEDGVFIIIGPHNDFFGKIYRLFHPLGKSHVKLLEEYSEIIKTSKKVVIKRIFPFNCIVRIG
jgi:trans-aconitate methyltransferase